MITPPIRHPESHARRFRTAAAGMAALLSFTGYGCDNGAETVRCQVTAIEILDPQPGASINMDDTLRIVSRSDYNRFGGGLSFSFSEDSGKTWILIGSVARLKSGAGVLDTLPWFPKDFGIAPGPIMLMVREYDKVHMAMIPLTLTGALESGTGKPE